MTVGKRLSLERKKAGYSNQELFGDKLGVSFTTISRWEKGGAIPSDKLELMAEMGLDIIFILTGKTGAGASFSDSEINNINNIEKVNWRAAPVLAENDNKKSLNVEDYVFVPLYDVEVSAGSGAFLSAENIKTYLAFTKYSIKQKGLQRNLLACVQGKGDSMLPTICEEDTLMIDLRSKQADGGIFVFRVGDALYVKRLIREAEGIRVISDNPIYPAWMIKADDDYEIIGKRVWHARWD